MRLLFVSAFLAGIMSAGTASAGKVEDVQAAVKKACSKDVANADALRLVKDLFLSCTAGSQVSVEGCQVPCLKDNAGAVVGK